MSNKYSVPHTYRYRRVRGCNRIPGRTGSIKFYSADQVNEGVIDIKRFNSMHNDAVSNRKESLPSLAKMVENGIVNWMNHIGQP